MENKESGPNMERREFIKYLGKLLAGFGLTVFALRLFPQKNHESPFDKSLREKFEEQRAWTIEYIKSPKYRERIKRFVARSLSDKLDYSEDFLKRLKKSPLEEIYPTNIEIDNINDKLIDKIIKKRLNYVKNAKMGITDFIESKYEGIFGYQTTFFGAFFPPPVIEQIKNNIKTMKVYYTEETIKNILEGKNIIFERIPLILRKDKAKNTPVHELSHASTSADEKLNPKLKQLTEERIFSYYYNQATEVKARLDVLRYEMNKMKIYNPKTEDFTKEHLEKIKNTPKLKKIRGFRELMEYIEKDNGNDLIWYMNNVADIGDGINFNKNETLAYLNENNKYKNIS